MKKLIWLFAASATIIAGCSKKNSSDPTASAALLTLNLTHDDLYFYSSIYYVITDENGAIVSEAKYVSNTKSLTMTPSKPYKKERFNFYRIAVGKDDYRSEIRGWLQIKKGSHYNDDDQLLLQTLIREVRYHLKNLVPFTKLGVIGDYSGYSIAKLTDTVPALTSMITENGNLYVYLRSSGSIGINAYNFFNVANGANDVNIDMTQINKAPLIKNITCPGTNLQVQVRARPDKKYIGNYDLGLVTSKTNQLNYYYPQEQFAEYFYEMTYSLGEYAYYFVKNTDVIPDKVDTYSAVINTLPSNVTTFKPSFSGPVDYYDAVFVNYGPNGFNMSLTSSAATSGTSVKFPDFSKYLGKPVDLTKQVLSFFSLSKDATFSETNIPYKYDETPTYPNLDLKMISRVYN